jgi:phosphinothricin acetyltransferase
MSSISIRPVESRDLARITAIYDDAVRNGAASYELEPPTQAEMASRFEALSAGGFPCLVAEQDGALLGYAYAGPFRTRPAYRFVVEDSVYVAPEAKGRGAGSALMRALIQAVEALGFRQIVAVIGDGGPHSPSVRLHEKLGFTHSGRLEGSGYKHGRWLDTTFMQLALNGGATVPPDPRSWPERAFRGE